MKNKSLLSAVCLTLCATSVYVAAHTTGGQEALAQTKVQSPASQPTPAPTGKPIARVMQTTITTGQIEPDDRTKTAAKQQLKGKQYDQWLTNAKYLKCAFSIWEPLQDQFCKERGIGVGNGEVDSFFDYSDRARKMQQRQLQAALTSLASQMQNPKLTAQDKQQGNALKAQFEQQLAMVSKQMPKPSQQEREVATKLIKSWKFDQAVYKQYGGQVIARATTPMEPIGAYRKFLEEKEKQKAFEVTDPTFKKKFWEVFTPAKDVTTVPANQVDFSKPWWVLLVERGQAAMDKK